MTTRMAMPAPTVSHVTARLASRLVLFLLAVGSAGCADVFGPDGQERLGRLSYYDLGASVQAPDSVTVGVPFDVAVRTYAGGCIGFGRTQVEYSSGTVDIRPWDVDSGGPVCTDDISVLEHTAEVIVDAPGTWLIRVHGRQVPPDSVIVIERSVHARQAAPF